MTLAQSNSLSKLFTSCSFSANSVDLESSEEEDINGDEFMSIVTSIRTGIPTSPISVIPLLPTKPEPLNEQYWTEPTAQSFNVRGPTYTQDRKKIPSQPSFFRLFAVDLVKVENPILKGMCNHPKERVQRCLNAEKMKMKGSEMPPFIFCVNITVPGTPAHHLVMYFAVDDFSLIDPSARGKVGSTEPFRKLASRFLFGDSDSFRDSTFKLIPRIVKGNFVVKKAVGSKPTILGKKLKQHYIQSDRFFEVVVDVGSDRIARKVVGLCTGYVSSINVFISSTQTIFKINIVIFKMITGKKSSSRHGVCFRGEKQNRSTRNIDGHSAVDKHRFQSESTDSGRLLIINN